ncbi:prostatic acid phosphatase-like [Pectinophora gossypiella]|uniref:prostatic acid phosphatase-like n=1 Tax=Pectinophora gossypiella TaxID=13191 RepID=UPI00214F4D8A|nr:prostatic acid phosphatase-like [Pectinophora gossypiella]
MPHPAQLVKSYASVAMILPMLLLVVCRCEANKLWELALEDEKEGKVVQVHVVHGSGHAWPPACYPGDPHARAAVWKHGPGVLTQHGRQQGFHFGENLRSRYLNFLPKERTYKYVNALTAKTTRSRMTSSMVLAGLLPPKDDDVWTITWPPAVVNVDDILANQHCDRLERLKKNVVYDTKSEELYLKVSSNTKKSVKTPLEMLDMYMCLDIQNQAGLPIPAWARALYSDMRREAAKGYQFDSEISRLEVGRILDTITKFNESEKGNNRINLYSVDNTIIGEILAALRFNQAEPPNSLTALVVEIREQHKRYHAQLWYRVGPFDDLVRLSWPGCSTRCSLTKLRTLLDPLIPKDWSTECKQIRTASSTADIVIISLVLLAFVLVYIATASGNRIYHYVTEFIARRKRSVKTEA